MNHAPQKIFRIRRDYNSWVANETLEDYALRYTPQSARKWSELRVANTALGGVSFLALEAIGGAIALNYGFSNALWAILVMGLVTFLTGLPIAVYAARYGLDMDLLTRGAGFGYLGSTVTSLIYASFTFIFFALEAAIMALALQLVLDWPLVWCYVLSSLVIIPMVLHGITFISRLQTWTQPLWVVLLLWPFAWFALAQPDFYVQFTGLSGLTSGSNDFEPLMFGAAAAGDLRARAADRRAGGLPALHACTHLGQPLALVGRSARGGPGLDLAGHAQDAGRGLSGLRRAAVRHIAAARG